jgi:hypothetical protein
VEEIMPRKDPITGCNVMTSAEFWRAEAEHEGLGREPAELMEDFYAEWAAADRASADKLKTDKAGLLKKLQEVQGMEWDCVDEEDHDKLVPEIIEVIEVHGAEVHSNHGGSDTKVIADVRLVGGAVRRVKLVESESFGSFYEPPDGEAWLTFVLDDEK